MIGSFCGKRWVRGLAGAGVLAALAGAPAVVQTQAPSWQPPLGVPAPSFGVTQHAPAPPSSWTSERAGFYYVDNTHSLATDSVTYGSPARPRRSIPDGVPAGSVVEVHGGPYSYSNNKSIGGNGTASAPIFYRGAGNPRITSPDSRRVDVWGSYVVVEGFDFVNVQVTLVGQFQSLRDNDIHGKPPAPGGCAVYVGGQNVVVLRNYIHNNGDPNYFDENDIHGVLVGTGAERVWIVENEMHGNGGDSVQVNSGTSTLARLIYIGRNRMHEEGENAIDIKTAEDVIISQNDCWGFKPTQFQTSGSDGTAIVVNDDNARNGLNNRIWILFNHVHDSTVGIRTQAHAYVIGNVIRSIQNAAILTYGAHDVHVEHNTMYRIGRALERSAGNVGNKVVFANNIVNTRSWDDLKVSGNATSSSVVAHSLFQSPAVISWGGGTFGLASFAAAYGCQGCREGNPGFLDPARLDLRLSASSPAIGGAVASALYGTYKSTYGVSIAYDVMGRSRPGVDGKWDMGALEGDGIGLPAPPSDLRIIR